MDCKIVGHSAGGCDEKNGNTNTRDSYKRMNGNRMRSSRHKEKGNTYHRGRSRTHKTRDHEPSQDSPPIEEDSTR